MEKPVLKFEGGKLSTEIKLVIDADVDGKPAVQAAIQIEIDAAEAISEIAKKDLPWLEAILSQLKA